MTSSDANPYRTDDLLEQDGAPAAAPAEVHAETAEEGQAPAHTASSVSAGSILLVGLFLGGAAGLYLLSRGSGPEPASADQKLTELRVDTALTHLLQTDVKSSRATEVVNTFYYQAKQRQIPVQGLRGNPFVLRLPPPPKLVAAPEQKKAPAPAEPADKSPEQETKEVRKLVLQSVLVGSHEPVAMISNNLLTEGQSIHGWTVMKIERRQVTLRWKDKTYVLQMSQ